MRPFLLALAISPSLAALPVLARVDVASAAPTPARAPAFDVARLHASLDKAIADARAQGFSGVLVVARDGKPVYQAAVGEADREAHRAVTPDTRFNLASAGKMFTTVAVLQLVEQGKLDLDAPVGRYLPDWPQAQVRGQVTIRQLLTHTAGLGSFFGAPGYAEGRAHLASVRDYLPLFDHEAPAFAPGSDFGYSNSGFVLLGRILEVVGGHDYYALVRQRVFAPAGMRDSGYYDAAGTAKDVAVGYVATADGLQRNDDQRELRGGPAGGGYSTAGDLLRFRQALLSGKLLRAATLDLLLTPIELPGEGALRKAGLGMIVAANGDDVSFGHPGGGPGMSAEFWSQRKGGWSLVLLSNVAPVPRSGVPPVAMMLAAQAGDALVAAGGPRLGGGARRRG